MFANIPKNRLLLYLIVLGLLPSFFVILWVKNSQRALESLDFMIESVENKVINYKRQQSANLAVVDYYRDADHFYIDKHLETLTFLEPEIEALQKIVNHKNFTGDLSITKRFDFLTGQGNSMVFTEGVVQSYPLYQETTESLTHSIEVNVQDIQKVLSCVEGVEIGPYKPGPNRPQLIVLDFKLDKKKLESDSEVFNLNMKLLKREYL